MNISELAQNLRHLANAIDAGGRHPSPQVKHIATTLDRAVRVLRKDLDFFPHPNARTGLMHKGPRRQPQELFLSDWLEKAAIVLGDLREGRVERNFAYRLRAIASGLEGHATTPVADSTKAAQSTSEELRSPQGTSQPSNSTAKLLRVDPGQRKAFYGCTELHINSCSGFAVLAALVEAKGKVVLNIDLCRATNSEEVSPSVDAMAKAPPEIKCTVSRIRRALKEASAPHRIRCVRGKGYILLCPHQ